MGRKWLSIGLVLLLLVSMTACGGNAPSQSSAPSVSGFESDIVGAPNESTSATEEQTTPSSGTHKPSTSADDTQATTTATRPTGTMAPSASGSSASTVNKSSTTVKKTTTSRKTTTKKTTTATTTATTAAPMSEKEAFLSQDKTTVTGSPADKNTWSYLLGISGLCVREAVIDAGLGGEPVEIAHITDIHFNKLNDRDFAENNPSVMSTYEQRVHLANGASCANAERCMKFGSFFDQTVITGDTLDYLTWGALEMMEEVIWKPYPETLIALGNHEPVRIMGLANDVSDPTTLASRYQILQDNWKHDIYYTSKVIKDKVMVIQMDNSQNRFYDHQVPKLQADLDTARQKGYAVLLFMHIPLKAGATGQVPDLIFNNADVVRGIFTGHTHNLAYHTLPAKTPSGAAQPIPQYVGAAAFLGRGNVTWIQVK